MKFKTLWVRRAFRVLFGVVLFLGLLAGAVHTFLYYRAGELFKNFVENTSGGEYTASTQKFRFGYFPIRLRATGVDFYPLDSVGMRRKYTVHADSLQLNLTSLRSILFDNSLIVSKVRLVRPLVKMESDLEKTPRGEIKFNIPLKEIQDGLLKSLDLLEVDKCEIIDGGFNLLRTDLNERLAVNHINLTIDSLVAARGGMLNQEGDSVNANLILSINKPDILLPDSNYFVDIDRLYVDTRKNVFNIEELNFSRKKEIGTYDTLKLSSIALRGLNWDRFLNEGMIELDSVRVKNGLAQIDLTDRLIFRKRKDKKKDDSRLQIAVPLFLKYVSIAQITYQLRSLRKTGPFTMLLDGDSLQLSSFALKDSAIRPVTIGSLSLNVRNFYDQDDKKTYITGFDRMLIRNDDLSIGNYRLIPLKRAGFSSNNRLKIPSLILYNYDLTSLLQGRLQADRLELIRPEVVVDILHKRDQQAKVAGDGLFKVLNNLQRSLDIRELSIRDASVILQPRNDLANSITISQLNTDLNVEKLLDASSVNDLFQVAEDIRSDGFFLSGPRFDLRVTNALIAKGTESVNFGRLKGNISNLLEVDLDSVSIRARPGELLIPVDGILNLESVNVGGGVVMIIKDETNDSIQREKRPAPDVNIDRLQTGKLQVTYFEDNGSLFAVQEMAIDMEGLEAGRNKLRWSNLFLKGQTLITTAGKQNIRIGEWEGNVPGTLTMKDVKFWPLNRNEIGINLDIPILEAKNTIGGIKWDPKSVTDLTIINPQLRWNLVSGGSKPAADAPKPKVPVFLQTVTIIDPEISGERLTKKGIQRHTSLERGNLYLQNVDLFYKKPDFVTMSAMSANLVQAMIEIDSTWTLHPDHIRLLARDFSWKMGEIPSGLVDTLLVEGIGEVPLFSKPNQSLTVKTAGISGWTYPFSNDSLYRQFLYGPNWWLRGVDYTLKGPISDLMVYNASAFRQNRMIMFDSLTMIPKISQDSFWSQYPVEKDYIVLRTGHTQIRNFRPIVLFMKDSIAEMQSVHTKGLELSVARDKRIADDTVAYRPMLAEQIGQIPFEFKLDSLMVEKGRIAYYEISEKFKQEGYLTIDNLHGNVLNFFSRPAANADSFKLDLSGSFMNNAPMNIQFAQPYGDSLQSFRFNISIGKWYIPSINPLVVPLSSLGFKRGYGDTMWLNATGDKYRAYGWMGFKYKKLKVNILKGGQYGGYFMSGLVDAGTNLVIDNNNKGGATPLYTERSVNKSTFNYWGKILTAGMKANLGVPGNKKAARKAMRRENIPDKVPKQ
jgi:hypothetical protein